MKHNIVVGVDGSDGSLAALRAAAKLAEQTGSRLSVVFVHELGAARSLAAAYDGSAEVYIEQSIEELGKVSRERTFDLLADRPLEWAFDEVAGEAVHELIDVAKERSASMIVVGGRGHSVVGGLVLGSVAQKLVRSSPISVLVVRNATVDDDLVAELQPNRP
jgi:nucleotide-binding universal stress UspA family protein